MTVLDVCSAQEDTSASNYHAVCPLTRVRLLMDVREKLALGYASALA